MTIGAFWISDFRIRDAQLVSIPEIYNANIPKLKKNLKMLLVPSVLDKEYSTYSSVISHWYKLTITSYLVFRLCTQKEHYSNI